MCAKRTPEIALDGLASLLAELATPGGRAIVSLAGAPESGKSWQAEALEARLNVRVAGMAAVLPIDGSHFDDLYLDPAGLRPRKDAPDTFDDGGLAHALRRLRARDEAAVAVPVFDRSIEIARAGALLIPAEVPVIVVEGNYPLLDRAPWGDLAPLFDATVFLDVPEAVLRDRLLARWRDHGLPEAEARTKVDGNDLPNAHAVIAGSRAADYWMAKG